MDNAFEYVKENGGLDTETSYPYNAHQGKCHFNKKNVGATCTGYNDIVTGDEEALKEADLVVLIGTVADFRLGYGKVLSRKSKIISVNRNKSQLTKVN